MENNSLLNESFLNLEAKDRTVEENDETPDKVKSRKRLNIDNDTFSQESLICSYKSPARKKKKEVSSENQTNAFDSDEDFIILDDDYQTPLEFNEASFFISGSEDKTCKVN